MIRTIARATLLAASVFFAASGASAQTQTQTNCTASPDYAGGSNINCTSTSTSQSNNDQQRAEQQREAYQTGQAMGAALGNVIEHARARHFCKKNPNGWWQFSNGNKVYCSSLVKIKSTKNVPAPVSIIAATPQTPTQSVATHSLQNIGAAPTMCNINGQFEPCTPTDLVPQSVPAAMPQVQPQAQPQMVDASASTLAPEMSVAEAARRNRAARKQRRPKRTNRRSSRRRSRPRPISTQVTGQVGTSTQMSGNPTH